ncbi:O-methyltransferase-domain-containing protein [Desarmillaria tabescens]|uniref:O-methyltransferase-domain-containing protein n=1 Tax=Armillaria tabescens TaxID=1929756 RepID=A0AA39JER4_ARMTA|nr:O-methyltransferase-domain-containing protein [Desarmillaria tabescens]KAK0441263.1 O-methyltransferase-domain-containing protein [Desarmillaria tabescens]
MHSQLSKLVSLISSAVDVVQETFAKTSRPEVPSLDDTTRHPLDSPESSSMELMEAIQTIEGACAQLCALVARPNHTMLNRVFGMFEPACIRVAIEFKIADHLFARPEGLHVSELGALSGVEPQKLGRILSLLASKHCFRKIERDVFANNRLSMALVSVGGIAAYANIITDEVNKSASMLTENLRDPDWGHSYSPAHAPFNSWSKYSGSIYSWYEGIGTDDGVVRGMRFGQGMKEWNATTETSAIINEYPWVTLRDGATMCDVGGGIGSISMQLAEAYPHLRIVLQDLPAPIQNAKNDIWPKLCPAAIETGRVDFKAMDFLVESPVGGCEVYYLKHVIHNWPDKECKMILTGVKNAMGRSSRLLIHEYLIQPVNRENTLSPGLKEAPDPLLPNYGAGRIREYNLDLAVMCLFNGQERQLDQIVELCRASGLNFVRVWDFGESGLVEFCLE